MLKKNFLYFLTVGFIAGILVNYFWDVNVLQIMPFAGVSVFVYAIVFRRIGLEQGILGLIILGFFLLGIIRTEKVNQESALAWLYGETITVTGEIYSEPSFGAFSNRYKIKIEEITTANGEIMKPKENIIISAAKYPEYKTGDRLRVSGKLQKPENFDNENGIEFDYVNFLRKDKINGLIYYSKIQKLGSNQSLAAYLFAIKQYFLRKISTILPSPQAELMGGLLLGVKQSLGDELEKQFRVVGLIHVVVLSGYNITIIIVAVFKFLAFLPRLVKYGMGVLFVVAFAIMVGSGATVIRASIMAILVIVSKLSSRNYDINRSLFFAGLVMIIQNPLILFYDPSFQLSFMASIGLVNFSEKVSSVLKFVPEKFEMREIVAASFSTQIAVLPLIMRMTGELSIVALPANLIVLPLIPLTMLGGFLTGIFAIVFWPAGLLFGFLPNLLLSFQLAVVDFFANLPFALVNVRPPTLWQAGLFYCFVVIVFYYRPIQVCKKVFNVLSFPARLIVGNK